jgi:hypothetical protein
MTGLYRAEERKRFMNEDQTTRADSLIEEVRSALNFVNDDNVASGLEMLIDCEKSILLELPLPQAERSSVRRHMMNWVQLQRASVLSDLARFDEAEQIFVRVRNAISDPDTSAESPTPDCYCEEYASATMGLASLVASRGDFSVAIDILRNLVAEVRSLRHPRRKRFESDAVELLNKLGTSLGYDNLTVRLGLSLEIPDAIESSLDADSCWNFPFPLLGEMHFQYQRNYNDAYLRFQNDESSESRFQTVNALLQTATNWVSASPNSIVAQEYLVLALLSKGGVEIETSRFSEFDETITQFRSLLAGLMVDSVEDVYFRFQLAASIYNLATVILNRDFEDTQVWQACFSQSASLNALAFTMLELDMTDSPLTQATAIKMMLLEHIAALHQDLLENPEAANLHRSRRTVILEEILVRDPTNDEAIRLHEHFKLSPVSAAPEIEEEIRSWHWQIVPIV